MRHSGMRSTRVGAWGKALKRGLYEFRVRRTRGTICQESGHPLPPGLDPDQKVLLRAFFAVEGSRIVLLLSGYDKGRDSSGRRQDLEIRRARKLLKEHRELERRAR